MLPESLDLEKAGDYVCVYDADEVLFNEGEESHDLFWLLEGELEVLKGNKVIAYINEPGAIFGEMSFLLGAPRSATVRAHKSVKTLCLPKEGMNDFLAEHPEVLQEMSQILAQRLAQTSEVLLGLKEFCDQLPDAVLLVDSEGKVVSLNSAAEDLYGRRAGQLKNGEAADIFEEPDRFRELLERTRSGRPVSERALSIKHPSKGKRFISLSMKALSDREHEAHGAVALGRDVTKDMALKRRFRWFWLWVLPLVVLVLGGLGGYAFWYQPTYGQGQMVLDERQVSLKTQMGKDYFLLRKLLKHNFGEGHADKTRPVLKEFLSMQKDGTSPYVGLVLLGPNKRVTDAWSVDDHVDHDAMIGSTYARIDFRGDEDSLHRVMEAYRSGKTGSYRTTEVAFRVREGGVTEGWIIFQMDPAKLKKRYGLTTKDLESFTFREP